MIRVLFVCLGNICRSPTAEAVFRAEVEKAGLSKLIDIDSAGTSNWHVGKAPDPRAIQAGKSRHYDLSALRGRQAISDDFEAFDYVLAMDQSNFDDLAAIAPSQYLSRLHLFLDFSKQDAYREVPDPYYGGDQGFALVLDLIEDASQGLLLDIQKRLKAGS
ncbi:low molecular weight protein-tyrosine-phosphatase [Agaribacterium sp. ZY112]|uniref:low molecular weight protein-tyrosine-phosphatase n=1 Tax=Agaribacterium sp. ZY112 TaxID=3233574 RepID=UPI0035262A60